MWIKMLNEDEYCYGQITDEDGETTPFIKKETIKENVKEQNIKEQNIKEQNIKEQNIKKETLMNIIYTEVLKIFWII